MYKKFYGLKEKPFALVPNPRCLYLSKKHQNALTYLEYGLSEGSGFILLTGDIGSGKTTVMRHILNKIEHNAMVEVGVISNTNVNSGELLKLVIHEFGIQSTSDDKAKTLDAIFQYLIKAYSQGKRVVLVVDEAQNLSTQSLEEIRMISNLQTDDDILLQIILIGQPDLKRRLSTPALTQLSQRISVFYHLKALDRDEIREYIAFRLKVAGGFPDLFEEETYELIYKASGGIPRIINILCDTALVYGYAESSERITAEILQQVIHDKEGLGLMVNELTLSESLPVKDSDGTFGYDQRFIDLEYKVANLQQQIEKRLVEADQQRAEVNARLITKLTELLRDERARSDKLMADYERLKAEFDLYMHAKRN